MANTVEEAALQVAAFHSREAMRGLYKALLEQTLVVPTSGHVRSSGDRHDVPCLCIRLADGRGCLPVFTYVQRFLEWKPQGCDYVDLGGRQIFEMAAQMRDVDCISVNHAAPAGLPKGQLSRSEFDLLARGILPTDVAGPLHWGRGEARPA